MTAINDIIRLIINECINIIFTVRLNSDRLRRIHIELAFCEEDAFVGIRSYSLILLQRPRTMPMFRPSCRRSKYCDLLHKGYNIGRQQNTEGRRFDNVPVSVEWKPHR